MRIAFARQKALRPMTSGASCRRSAGRAYLDKFRCAPAVKFPHSPEQSPVTRGSLAPQASVEGVHPDGSRLGHHGPAGHERDRLRQSGKRMRPAGAAPVARYGRKASQPPTERRPSYRTPSPEGTFGRPAGAPSIPSGSNPPQRRVRQTSRTKHEIWTGPRLNHRHPLLAIISDAILRHNGWICRGKTNGPLPLR